MTTLHRKSSRTSNNRRAYRIRLVLIFVLAFFTGAADVLAVVRFATFVGQMTGNVVFFGISTAPPDIVEAAGVYQNPLLYLCVTLSNLFGALLFGIVERFVTGHERSGTGAAAITVVFGALGNAIYHFYDASSRDSSNPWVSL